MYRTSGFTTGLTTGFLAMALGVAAIASAATPAAAFPGDPNKPVIQFHPGQVASPVPATSPIKAKLPILPSPGKPVLQVPPIAQVPHFPPVKVLPPIAQLPPVKVLPPIIKLPHPIDDICPDNPLKCPPKPIGNPGNPGNQGNPGGGTVVIVTPPVEVPIAVPVAVPVRIGGGGAAYAGPARPTAAPQCSAASNTPELAAGIDQLLPIARLSEADKAEVAELRQTIQVLAASGKIAAARDVEEVAMKVLGYRKVALGCGPGSFDWEQQQVASSEAVQQK